MPRKAKKSQAASCREARKAHALSIKSSGDQYQFEYRPSNPDCQPYWDAFYTNPYPSKQECQAIAERLGSTFATIDKWFKLARQYTHAPDNGPDSDAEEADEHETEDQAGSETEKSDCGAMNTTGTLYEHFYSKIQAKNCSTKRNRSNTVAESDVCQPVKVTETKKPRTKEHQHGPRGPYTKNSRTTVWQNHKHAQGHASDIRNFFSSIGRPAKDRDPSPEVVIVGHDSGVEVLLESDGMHKHHLQGSFEGHTGAPEAPVQPETGAMVGRKVIEQQMMMVEYQTALTLLQASMNELKLNVKVPSDDVVEEQVADDCGFQVDEGLTLEDVEIAIQESTALLDNDEDEGSESFYTILNRHLQCLLTKEKKSKLPNIKTLIELTVLSDYNNLRESFRNAGHRAPSTQASNRIAEAKFIPT
ncbi:hypothetical protein FRC10_007572, partial [Ceratobasidium sp. 414]